MADGNKGFLDFSFINTGSVGSSPTPPGNPAGTRGFLDFILYNVGSATSTPPAQPPGISCGTPLIFDMQQPGLMELQSFFPCWSVCLPVRVPQERIDVVCGELTNDISVGGQLDNPEGVITCCL